MFNRLKTYFVAVFFIAFLFSPPKIFAQVVINEFQVRPDQWIELYNKGGDSMDISGWIVDDNGGTEKYIISSGIILPSKKCVSFQSGDFHWNIATGDTVKLLDSNSNLKEEYSYSSAPGEDVSIGRLIDGEGGLVVLTTSSQDELNATGESCLAPIATSTPIPTSIPPTPTPTSAPAANDYENIYISEYLPFPESGNEWVELYNDNDSGVNLSGWYVDDIDGGGRSPIGISGTISARSYKQFFIGATFLNDDGDDVRLLNSNRDEKDSTSFETSTKGKSWAMGSDGNWCQVDPTPGSSNPSCPAPTSSATSTPTPTSTPRPPTSTPTLKPLTVTPTLKPSPTATGSGEILGQESSPAAFYPWEATEGAEPVLGEKSSSPNRLLPAILLGAGFILLFSAAFWLWYTQLRK